MRSGQYVKQAGGYRAFIPAPLPPDPPIEMNPSVRLVERHLQCSYVTASKLADQLVELGLLRETTGWQRNRRYRYEPYLALFEPSGPTTAQTTADDSITQTDTNQ